MRIIFPIIRPLVLRRLAAGAMLGFSLSRLSFGNHPALNDWNLGFRVVLVTEL